MAFLYNCPDCPMKLTCERDLKTHLTVHSESINYVLDDTEPIFTEFLQNFFPHLNSSDIIPINPNSMPSLPDQTEKLPSEDEKGKAYVTLRNMHVPGMVVPNLDDLIKIIPKTASVQKKPTKIRYLNPVRFARAVDPPVIQTVYIERPRRSVALIQNTHGDDRWSRPDVPLSRVSPTITRLRRLDPNEQERKIQAVRNMIPTPAPKEKIDSPKAVPIGKTIATKSVPLGGEQLKAFCSGKTFNTLNQTHSSETFYTCFLCHRQLASSNQLNRHLLAHTREDPPQEGKVVWGNFRGKRKGHKYSCTQCKRRFSRINYLNLHKRCHEKNESEGDQTQEPERDFESVE